MQSLLNSAKLRKQLVATSPLFVGLLFVLLLFSSIQADTSQPLTLAPEPSCTESQDPQSEIQCDNYLPIVLGTAVDWGGTWSRVGNDVITVDKFYSVAVCGDLLLAGSDLGVYSLKNPARDWTQEQASISGAITEVAFVPGDCTQAYAAILGHGVWRGEYSNVNGWTWEQRVDEGDQLKDARSLVIVPDTNGSPDIYVAGNFGVKWLDELPTADVTWNDTTLQTLTTSLSLNDGKVIASVWLDDVYLLIDADNWSRLSPSGPPPDKLIYQAIYGDGRGLAGTQTGAYLLEGGAWKRVDAVQQTTFAVALGDIGLFAGQRTSGVIGRVNDGSTWYPANDGFGELVGQPEFQIRDLYIHVDDTTKTMYAATTHGIYRWSGTP